MRLFKLIVTLAILCLIGIFFYQNMQAWIQPVNFKLNLYLVKTTPTAQLYVIILISLLVGFFAGLAVLLKLHFKTRRLLKRERQDRKQVQEVAAQVQAGTASANSSVPHNQGAESEKG